MEKVDLVTIHNAGGYGSEFDYDSELEARRARHKDLNEPKKNQRTKVAKAKEVTEEYNKEEGKVHRYHVLSLDAYSRHKKYINDYMLYYGGAGKPIQRDTSRDKRYIDVIRENHKFLWDEDDEDSVPESWEQRLAKKYYDKLFKEYCITDLSRYKENKIAMRWRIEKEVVVGKGQFICGNKKCEGRENLKSWEVNFAYMEQNEKKNALVKLRLCPECSHKLNYRHKKREIKQKRKRRSEDHSSSKKQRTEKKKPGSSEEESDTEKTSEKKDDVTASTSTSSAAADPDNPWSGPAVILEEKSQEEEFDDYFEDMFL